ncbi:MAG: biotin--[acetyl-CoA-carboxylase] ligase [Ignavibacteriaceae bacterium]
MNLDLLTAKLKKEKLLSEIIYFKEIESTNFYAKKNYLKDDTLILTSIQTRGKGRFSRIWQSSADKDLTLTLIKHFNLRIDESHLVNFYTSYILFYTLKKIFSENDKMQFSLKWPNDIMLNGKKVAGILSEVSNLKSSFKKFIIGIGINVNSISFSEEINSRATSLFKESKIEINAEELLISFIKNFYLKINLITDKNKLMKEWVKDSIVDGKEIQFKKFDDDLEIKAYAVGVDNDGALILRLKNGEEKKFYSGEIGLIV